MTRDTVADDAQVGEWIRAIEDGLTKILGGGVMRGEIGFCQAGSPKGFRGSRQARGAKSETTYLSGQSWPAKPATGSTAQFSPNFEKARSTLSTARRIAPLSNYPGRPTLDKAQQHCIRRRLL